MADAKNATTTDLKPCPFCGWEAKAFKWGATYEIEIVCQNEDCRVRQSGIVTKKDDESEKEAYERAYQIVKEKWNRRADNEADRR